MKLAVVLRSCEYILGEIPITGPKTQKLTVCTNTFVPLWYMPCGSQTGSNRNKLEMTPQIFSVAS